MSHAHAIDIFKEPRKLEELGPRVVAGGLVLGIVFVLLALFISKFVPEIGSKGFYYAYLVGLTNILAVALGALFFTMLQHATGAGWSIVLRRLAEGIAMTIPFIGLLLIPVLMNDGFNTIYEAWQTKSESPLVQSKGGFLSPEVFRGVMIGSILLWSALAWFFFSNSLRQDRSGDPAISRKLRTAAYPGIIVFALSVSLAAFLLLMSINPEWYSTIFGVYFFAGCFMSFNAFLVLTMFFLQKSGRLTRAITIEHFHDVGKLCFTFIVFWAYIAFSQYMLIWYANLPEETIWFRPHHDDPSWGRASTLLILGHFFLPFAFILSRHIKRNPPVLAVGCLWVLLMHWLDHFWIVMPRVNWGAGPAPDLLTLMLMSVLCSAGFFCLLAATAGFVLRRCALAPERDPRLHESLLFENF